jgi:hypothetical protein
MMEVRHDLIIHRKQSGSAVKVTPTYVELSLISCVMGKGWLSSAKVFLMLLLQHYNEAA